MPDSANRNLIVLLGGAVLVSLLLLERPDYFADSSALGALLAAEILLAAVIKYKQAFFPVLIGSFLWAGASVPYRSEFLRARWGVLAVGAIAGLLVYLRDRIHHFRAIHLIGFFCVLSAVVSALVSAYPEEAILKAISLGMLFVYTACGGRVAVSVFQPETFFRKLVVACEVLTYFTAISYFVFRWEFLGNPNSLGAVMGVVVVPVLLWGLLIAETQIKRQRLALETMLAILLLMSSLARAGMAAAVISCLLICTALREYRLLIKGFSIVAVLAMVSVFLIPHPRETPRMDESQPVSAIFLYKGEQAKGVLGSRRGVWEQTWTAIKANPWFGSGFGTSIVTEDMTKLALAKSHVDSWVIREHGNSYLAIAEWVGLLGVLPFYSLVLMLALTIRKTFAFIRLTGWVSSPAIPAAAIVSAGLVHAMFEDWMFAVGYYLCVFFWTIAFILMDLSSEQVFQHEPYPAGEIPSHVMYGATLPSAS